MGAGDCVRDGFHCFRSAYLLERKRASVREGAFGMFTAELGKSGRGKRGKETSGLSGRLKGSGGW